MYKKMVDYDIVGHFYILMFFIKKKIHRGGFTVCLALFILQNC